MFPNFLSRKTQDTKVSILNFELDTLFGCVAVSSFMHHKFDSSSQQAPQSRTCFYSILLVANGIAVDTSVHNVGTG